MNAQPSDLSEAGALASMFDAARIAPRAWGEDELAAVLRHQLAAPLASDLGTMRGVGVGEVEQLAREASPPVGCFGELLHHRSPPVELLELTKRFAKRARCAKGAGVSVPKQVAAVLYFASIHVAASKCGRRISALPDAELRDGLSWVRAQHWVDAGTRELLGESRS